MVEITQKTSNRSPYVLVCFQECERMNILIREIRLSLQQLDLGLKVSFQWEAGTGCMSLEDPHSGSSSPPKGELTLPPAGEAQLSALSYDLVPDTWSKLAYPSTYGLAQW